MLLSIANLVRYNKDLMAVGDNTHVVFKRFIDLLTNVSDLEQLDLQCMLPTSGPDSEGMNVLYRYIKKGISILKRIRIYV